MKYLLTSTCATLLLIGCGNGDDRAAGSTRDAPAVAAAPAADAPVASATGTVEAVEPEAGRIVIAHGPVKALGWPGMTMGFGATAAQTRGVQPGERVRFEFRQEGSRYVITRIDSAE